MSDSGAEYDVFISHASEDKDSFVRPLAEGLSDAGLRVWYDEFELRVGSSLRQSIDEGIASSRYGVVVLSHAFFAKNWTEYELNGLVQRHVGQGGGVILPVWHDIGYDEVAAVSPSIADIYATTSVGGVKAVAREILLVVQPGEALERIAEEEVGATEEASQTETGMSPFFAPSAESQTEWFARHRGVAEREIADIGLSAWVEVAVTLEGASVHASLRQLMDASRQSQVHNFGWPVGLHLNRAEYAPYPEAEAIAASVPVTDESRPSYDHWAIRMNGDVFMVMSLFEDTRREGVVFFDTRAVRTMEILMYLHRLYTVLGVPKDATVRLAIRHKGLNGRKLQVANQNRIWFGDNRVSRVDEVQSVVTVSLADLEAGYEVVADLLSNLFEVFNFAPVGRDTIIEIARRYAEEGRT